MNFVRLNPLLSAHVENTDDIKDNGLDPKAIDNELILNGENGNGTGCVAHAFAQFVSNFVAHGDNGAVSSLKCARKLVLQRKKMKREKRTHKYYRKLDVADKHEEDASIR